MKRIKCDVAVLGAGPAGLAAAIAAKENGAGRVILVERDTNPGGILQQCIHPGFGLEYFHEELTGPEYAQRFIDKANALQVECIMGTMALRAAEGEIVCVNPEGLFALEPKALVLAMGCRERTRGNLAIPGSRPAGIYTAGTAQRLLNIQGLRVGNDIVILGSGDIGMIMARRLTLEGAKVSAVVEIMPYLAGLTRNKVQCLDDFGIPLLLSHTVVDITGRDRVASVTIAPVDENRCPLMDKATVVPCDTLLLSVGLIPENELSKTAGLTLSDLTRGPEVDQLMQTSVPGVFACGNVLHVNDLVDNVTREGEAAGRSAALYAAGKLPTGKTVDVLPGDGVRYVNPSRLVPGDTVAARIFFRVTQPMNDVVLEAVCGSEQVARRKSVAVNPGEMEFLSVSPEQLSGLGGPVRINVRQEVKP